MEDRLSILAQKSGVPLVGDPAFEDSEAVARERSRDESKDKRRQLAGHVRRQKRVSRLKSTRESYRRSKSVANPLRVAPEIEKPEGVEMAKHDLNDVYRCQEFWNECRNLHHQTFGLRNEDHLLEPVKTEAYRKLSKRSRAEFRKYIPASYKISDIQDAIMGEILSGEELIINIGHDALNSLCYEVPAQMKSGICLVVSPVRKLVDGKEYYLNQQAIESLKSGNSDSQSELEFIEKRLKEALEKALSASDQYRAEMPFKMLCLTPQDFLPNEYTQSTTPLLDILTEYSREELISFVVIEDASFFADQSNQKTNLAYKHLANIKDILTEVKLVCLTNPCPARKVGEIVKTFKLQSPKYFEKKELDERNVSYRVVRLKPCKRMSKYIESLMLVIYPLRGRSGIIYVSNPEEAQDIVNSLQKQHSENPIKVYLLHSEMNEEDKRKNLLQWKEDPAGILVTSCGFTIDVSKRNIRYVIHYSVPRSVEIYYQQCSIAGLDKLPADCIALYYPQATESSEYIVCKNSHDYENDINRYELSQIERFYESAHICRRQFLIRYLKNSNLQDEDRCTSNHCDNCRPKEPVDPELNLTLDTFDFGPALQILLSLLAPNTPEATLDLKISLIELAAILRGRAAKKRQPTYFKNPLLKELFSVLYPYSADTVKKFLHGLVWNGLFARVVQVHYYTPEKFRAYYKLRFNLKACMLMKNKLEDLKNSNICYQYRVSIVPTESFFDIKKIEKEEKAREEKKKLLEQKRAEEEQKKMLEEQQKNSIIEPPKVTNLHKFFSKKPEISDEARIDSVNQVNTTAVVHQPETQATHNQMSQELPIPRPTVDIVTENISSPQKQSTQKKNQKVEGMIEEKPKAKKIRKPNNDNISIASESYTQKQRVIAPLSFTSNEQNKPKVKESLKPSESSGRMQSQISRFFTPAPKPLPPANPVRSPQQSGIAPQQQPQPQAQVDPRDLIPIHPSPILNLYDRKW